MKKLVRVDFRSFFRSLTLTLPICNFTKFDIKKVVNLVNWGISSNNEEFKPKKNYNPLFSTRRCLLSKQNFGFHFQLKLEQAQLARVARIMTTSHINTPRIYRAQKLNKLNSENINSFSNIPSVLKPHLV